MKATTHVAGPLVAGVQKCAHCGVVLEDHSNSAWPADQEPGGYPEGATLGVVQGNPRITYEAGTAFAVAADETPCRLAT